MNNHKLSLSERHKLAIKLLNEIVLEWDQAEDQVEWSKEHVDVYDSRLSFDELIAELSAIEFKK